MKKIDVEVVGAKKPRERWKLSRPFLNAPKSLLNGMMKRPRLMLFSGAVGFLLFIGTPHIGWDYQCRFQMSSTQPCKAAMWCAYYGVQGRRVFWPEEWEPCKLVRFMRIDWPMLVGDLIGASEDDTARRRIELQLINPKEE